MGYVSILELDDTAQVTSMDGYGGISQESTQTVFWVNVQDAKGKQTQVCLDLREGSQTRGRLFEKARHPSKSGAILLELGSDEEGIVIPLISHWLDSDQPKKGGLRDEFTELAKKAFARLGEPTM